METTKKKVLFSGIQPTGGIHVGNYLGAIKNWIDLQSEYTSLFCVVDYHATTIAYDIESMKERKKSLAIQLIACGIDPEQCTLFIQSDVPEHLELAWIFNTVIPMGDLSRMTQFKEKSQHHAKNINVGLFTYPVLQAADILLYKGEVVPVGEDQVQHIELTREISRKFNTRFSPIFPETKALLNKGARIMGLDGKSKMSKSLDNHIELSETEESLWGKLRTAFTDPQRLRLKDPGRPEICNIHKLHTFYSTPSEVEETASACRAGTIGCFDCKKILCKNLFAALQPIQERTATLEKDPDYLENILTEGAQRARKIATSTLQETRETMGIKGIPRG